jgi:hypothetical protein
MHDKSPVGPTWQAPRRYPRFPLQTKVELRVENQILMATTDNVSAGGLLVECDPVLPRGTEIQLRFSLPNGFYVETPARVAHAKSGYGMGLEMLGLTREAREEISELARRIIGYTRRGARLPRQFNVMMQKSAQKGDVEGEMAQTILISRHGGLLVTRARFKADEAIYLWSPAHKKGSFATIVFRNIRGIDGLAEIGFRFNGDENFWGVDFPEEILS